jgi:hypothetical protein
MEPVMVAKTIEAQGTVFSILDVSQSPDAYVAIGEIVNIAGVGGGQANVIDVSTLASTRREKRMGLADEGQMTLTLHHFPSDAGQVLLHAARSSREVQSFRLTDTDSPPNNDDFQGFVLSAGRSFNLDEVAMLEVTVEITGAIS